MIVWGIVRTTDEHFLLGQESHSGSVGVQIGDSFSPPRRRHTHLALAAARKSATVVRADSVSNQPANPVDELEERVPFGGCQNCETMERFWLLASTVTRTSSI